MKKSNMLRKNKDFSFCYRRGKKISTPFMSAYYVKSKYNKRAGFSVSKKVGNAVTRNKVRRRMKEAFTAELKDIRNSCSIIFVAKSDIVNASYQEIANSIHTVLEKVDLI